MLAQHGKARCQHPAAEPAYALMTSQDMTVMIDIKDGSGSRGRGSCRRKAVVWTHVLSNEISFKFGGIPQVVSFGQGENGGSMASFRGAW